MSKVEELYRLLHTLKGTNQWYMNKSNESTKRDFNSTLHKQAGWHTTAAMERPLMWATSNQMQLDT